MKELNASKQTPIVEYFLECMPKFCLNNSCFRPNKRNRNFAKAREKLTYEMDLVRLIRQLRFFKVVTNNLLVPEKVARLKKDVQRLSIDKIPTRNRDLVPFEATKHIKGAEIFHTTDNA